MKIKIWLNALRLPFLTATIVPVVLGSTIAWHHIGRLNWPILLFTLLGVSFLHIGTNLANDYFDHKTKNDDLNLNPTPFSGGSRAIQNGLISSKKILHASLIFFCIGSMIGLYLTWQLKSSTILLLGIIGVFCGFFYAGFPFKIGYRGLGEPIVGLCFGPLVVFGAYYVQTQSFSVTPILASIPVAILITLVLYINEFPDYDADKQVNKKTLVVRLGKARALAVYHFLLGLVYLYVVICILFKLLPLYMLIVGFTLPWAAKAYLISKKNFLDTNKLLSASRLTVNLHLLLGLLLSAGFIMDRIF